MFCREELSACVDAFHAVIPDESHCPRGTTGSKSRFPTFAVLGFPWFQAQPSVLEISLPTMRLKRLCSRNAKVSCRQPREGIRRVDEQT
jgi:hypothetical protein